MRMPWRQRQHCGQLHVAAPLPPPGARANPGREQTARWPSLCASHLSRMLVLACSSIDIESCAAGGPEAKMSISIRSSGSQKQPLG